MSLAASAARGESGTGTRHLVEKSEAPPDLSSPGRIALIGNPNVGKSVTFGLLTGRYATVSNYPGTTVEVACGSMTIRDLFGLRHITAPDPRTQASR